MDKLSKDDSPLLHHEVSIDINVETTPVLYTDNIFMTTNPDGLVINVCQQVGNTKKLKVVSRIGMSREHAKKFAEKLGKLLALTEGSSGTGEQKRN